MSTHPPQVLVMSERAAADPELRTVRGLLEDAMRQAQGEGRRDGVSMGGSAQ